jgi:hypothetical protein
VDRAPLPAVTMVFASVEGGRALLRRRQDVGRLVHHMIGRIMQVRLGDRRFKRKHPASVRCALPA